MAFRLLLLPFLLILWGASQSVVSNVKPGALVAPIGKVLVVEDVLTVRYNLKEILDLRQNYAPLKHHVDSLLDALNTLLNNRTYASADLTNALSLQRQRVNRITQLLSRSHAGLPNDEYVIAKHAHARRPKRGLFNFVGILSQQLFGTAQADDVEKLGKRLSAFEHAAFAQNRVVSFQIKTLVKVQDTVNSLRAKLNDATQVINRLIEDTSKLERVVFLSELLTVTELDVQDYLSAMSKVLENLVDAALGRASTALIPVAQLREAVMFGKEEYSLIPLFSMDECEFYYPLLETILTNSAILVHIPFKSSHTFTAFRITPFPFPIDNHVLTVSETADIVVTSDDLQLVALGNDRILEQCRSTYLHLYVCPAFVFSFLPPTEVRCAVALTHTAADSSDLIEFCSYTPAPDVPIFHVHFAGVQYLYFRNKTQVTLICVNGDVKENHVSYVQGLFQAPDHCEVSSSLVTTLPNHQHLALLNNLHHSLTPVNVSFYGNISHIKLITPELTLMKALNTSSFEDFVVTNLPLSVSAPVLYPSILTPTFIFLVIVLCVFYCQLRLWFRVDHLARRRQPKAAPEV